MDQFKAPLSFDRALHLMYIYPAASACVTQTFILLSASWFLVASPKQRSVLADVALMNTGTSYLFGAAPFHCRGGSH